MPPPVLVRRVVPKPAVELKARDFDGFAQALEFKRCDRRGTTREILDLTGLERYPGQPDIGCGTFESMGDLFAFSLVEIVRLKLPQHAVGQGKRAIDKGLRSSTRQAGSHGFQHRIVENRTIIATSGLGSLQLTDKPQRKNMQPYVESDSTFSKPARAFFLSIRRRARSAQRQARLGQAAAVTGIVRRTGMSGLNHSKSMEFAAKATALRKVLASLS